MQRGHQEVLGAGVGGRLDDVDIALQLDRRGAGEGGLADPWLAEETRVQRHIVVRKQRPRRQQLQQHLALADPRRDLAHRPGQVELDALDLNNTIQTHHRPPKDDHCTRGTRARVRPPSAVCDRGRAASVAAPSERKRSSVAIDLARYAPSARRRAAFGQGRTPLPIWDRADSGPLAAFSSLRSVGTITRSVPPRSSRRNAPRGPISSRSRNLRCAAVSRGLVRSCNPRGRCGGFAAPGTAAAGLCCGPQYAAIWRSQATASSRRLAALATRPSATAPRRLEAPRGGFKSGVGGGTLKTQNSYFFRGLVGISRSHRGPVEKLSVFSSVSSLCLCGSSVCDRQIRNPKSEIRNFFGWACRPMLLTPCVIMRGPVEVV